MNLSKISANISNYYNFKDENEMFKVGHSDKTLPAKICESLKYYGDNPKVRVTNEWIIAINQNSMLIWKYSYSQQNVISACKEYFLPNSELVYSPNQGTIIFDQNNRPISCIIVGDDGLVRFWPELSLTQEYIDQKIPNIYNDSCVMIEKVTNDVLIFIFKSMKLIIADLKDYSEAGISFKQFTQPVGFISRCFSSFFVSSYNQHSPFITVKTNTNLKEDLELMLLFDNNIDSLGLDILHNGKYTKAVLNHNEIRKEICKRFPDKFSVDPDHLNTILKYFDLCNNIFYVFVEINQPGYEMKFNFLVTYNRNLDVFDSVACIDGEFDGDVELSVIDDNMGNGDQPCLLAAIKDNHRILILEVLTGAVKANFNAAHSMGSGSLRNAIVGWTCPRLIHEPSTIITAVTASKQIVFIKQNINPFANESICRLQTETNLSNASFADVSTRNIGHRGDMEPFNVTFASKLHPMALSTPKSKLDHMGDRFAEENIANKNQFDPNVSNLQLDHITDQSAYGEFKKCVMLFWLGYKTRVTRSLAAIIEASQVDPEISIPILALQIAREIIDEHPTKDPRWFKVKNQSDSNKFCFSNKSLILSQQLSSKREALQNLILMLKENQFNIFGTMGNVAPMSVYKTLFIHGGKSDHQLFGDCQINWSLVNCIGLGGELLEFVRIFNEIMLNNQCPDINAILTRSCQDILSIQKKLTPIDIFGQQVSLVPLFIDDCCDYLNEKRAGLSDLKNFEGNVSDQIGNVKRVCQLLSRILSACLRASLGFRKKFESTFIQAHFNPVYTSSSVAAPCWITEKKPIGVSESILDIVINLIDFSRGFDNHQIFDSAFEIVTIYLDLFKHRIEWLENFSRNQSELDRLFQLFKEYRFQLIGKLVEDGKYIEKSLELADRFQDFHWITALSEVLDEQSPGNQVVRLDAYLHKHSEIGFSEYVLDWYQDKLKEGGQQNQGKLLAKIQLILEKIQKLEGTNMSSKTENSNSSMVIGKFLERTEVQATRWLHEIEVDDFSQAARTLIRLGEAEKLSLGRRKNLLSLAKLSSLAAQDSFEERDAIMETACCQLELMKFQEDIPPQLVESLLGYSPDIYNQPLIDVPQLVKLLLASVGRDDPVDVSQIVRALQLVDFSYANLSEAEFDNLLSAIWSRAILADNWDQVSVEDDVRSTGLASVMKLAAQSRLDLDKLLPDIDSLFADELLAEISQDSHLVYTIKRAFETLTTTLHYEGNRVDMDVSI